MYQSIHPDACPYNNMPIRDPSIDHGACQNEDQGATDSTKRSRNSDFVGGVNLKTTSSVIESAYPQLHRYGRVRYACESTRSSEFNTFLKKCIKWHTLCMTYNTHTAEESKVEFFRNRYGRSERHEHPNLPLISYN